MIDCRREPMRQRDDPSEPRNHVLGADHAASMRHPPAPLDGLRRRAHPKRPAGSSHRTCTQGDCGRVLTPCLVHPDDPDAVSRIVIG
jgi:hypothetical protein